MGIVENNGLTSKPSYGYLLHNIGVCKGQKNDQDGEISNHLEAIAVLDKIGHQKNTMYTHILYDLAVAQLRQGFDDEARENVEKANAVFDENPRLRSANRAHSLMSVAD